MRIGSRARKWGVCMLCLWLIWHICDVFRFQVTRWVPRTLVPYDPCLKALLLGRASVFFKHGGVRGSWHCCIIAHHSLQMSTPWWSHGRDPRPIRAAPCLYCSNREWFDCKSTSDSSASGSDLMLPEITTSWIFLDKCSLVPRHCSVCYGPSSLCLFACSSLLQCSFRFELSEIWQQIVQVLSLHVGFVCLIRLFQNLSDSSQESSNTMDPWIVLTEAHVRDGVSAPCRLQIGSCTGLMPYGRLLSLCGGSLALSLRTPKIVKTWCFFCHCVCTYV